jgi:hypothetical protein
MALAFAVLQTQSDRGFAASGMTRMQKGRAMRGLLLEVQRNDQDF